LDLSYFGQFLLTTHRDSGGSHSFVKSNKSASLSFVYAAWSVRIAQSMVRALTQHGLCALGQYIRTGSIALYSLDLISSVLSLAASPAEPGSLNTS